MGENSMEMRQEGQRGDAGKGLMSEWNIMYDRHGDTPDGKIGMFMSQILKTCSGAGRTHTPLIANAYSAREYYPAVTGVCLMQTERQPRKLRTTSPSSN